MSEITQTMAQNMRDMLDGKPAAKAKERPWWEAALNLQAATRPQQIKTKAPRGWDSLQQTIIELKRLGLL